MNGLRARLATTRVRAVGCGAFVLLGAFVVVVVLRPGQSLTVSSSLAGKPSPTAAGRPAGSVTPSPAGASPPTVVGSAAVTLITNEYAYQHSEKTDAARSPDWIVTSGSLFRAGGLLWSGHPDDQTPGPTSASGTGSAVLRAVSTRTDHADVRLSFALRVVGLTETRRTPGRDTDGVHAILRYQSEFSIYYVSVFRRDGQIAIKKKVPGGPSNGGTYYTLGVKPFAVDPAWPGTWHQVETTIARVGSGAVRLTLCIDGRPALDVVDAGADAPPVLAPGRVGLRGDNCEFYVRDFTATPLARP
jgi:hypothetical protein